MTAEEDFHSTVCRSILQAWQEFEGLDKEWDQDEEDAGESIQMMQIIFGI